MYNNPEDTTSEYEETLNRLSDQITELFSKIHFYQALVAEKEHQIAELAKENQRLLVKIQNLMHRPAPTASPSQQSYTPPPPLPSPQSYTPPPTPPAPPIQESQPTKSLSEQIQDEFSLLEDSRINKRVCPNCGAMGFAIREIDDKSTVISYSPRRMYAKKKSCTKCRYEWS
jgi:chromosome segregation ATPase